MCLNLLFFSLFSKISVFIRIDQYRPVIESKQDVTLSKNWERSKPTWQKLGFNAFNSLSYNLDRDSCRDCLHRPWSRLKRWRLKKVSFYRPFFGAGPSLLVRNNLACACFCTASTINLSSILRPTTCKWKQGLFYTSIMLYITV